MENEEWLDIIRGNKDAYEHLYSNYFKKFYNYGRKFTTDLLLIEDSIQEVFLEIWIKRESLKHINSLNSYFFSTFRNILLKKVKQAEELLQVKDMNVDPDFSIEQIIIAGEISQEMQRKIQAALNALTPRQREAIFLRFYENLSYNEIATILDISVKATYKIMARSLQSLKEKLPISLLTFLLLINIARLQYFF